MIVKRISYTVALFAIILIGVAFWRTSRSSQAHGGLGFVGSPVIAGSACTFTITNLGGYRIPYLPCPPQPRSNHTWADCQQPRGPAQMAVLLPRQTTNIVVEAPSGSNSWRLPVLYLSSPPPPMWRVLKNTAQGFFTGRNPGFTDNTRKTNFSEEVSR
jgi:hypothetical protein